MGTAPPTVGRRRFLASCAGSGLAPLAAAGPAGAASGESPDPGTGVLVDLTRCIGCRSCENACRVKHGHPPLTPTRRGFAKGEDRFSFTSWTYVAERKTTDAAGRERTVTVKRQCMHCVDPACASVCPVAALRRTTRGAVVYEAGRCIGCRYCVFACPFGVPGYQWDSGLAPEVGKCDFCDDRLAGGQAPACVAACPTGALRAGKRADLVREARERRELDPRRYPHLYGDREVGGTGWLYLSDVPPEDLGFPTGLPDQPLPSLTWKALQKVPFVVVGLGLLLAFLRRRTVLKAKTAAEAGHA